MRLRKNTQGYYAKQGFESHVCGMATRRQARRLLSVAVVTLVMLMGILPTTSNAAELDPAFAVKFEYNFGEPVEKSQLRMGFFLEERDHIELEGLGLLEVRLTPARGMHYAVFDKETNMGLLAWGKQQYRSLKGALRLDDLKAMVKDFQE